MDNSKNPLVIMVSHEIGVEEMEFNKALRVLEIERRTPPRTWKLSQNDTNYEMKGGLLCKKNIQVQ